MANKVMLGLGCSQRILVIGSVERRRQASRDTLSTTSPCINRITLPAVFPRGTSKSGDPLYRVSTSEGARGSVSQLRAALVLRVYMNVAALLPAIRICSAQVLPAG